MYDVINHTITLYKRNKALTEWRPLKFPEYPEAYQLRLIDDDETYYSPFYEIGPLDHQEKVGEFESLAFIEKKGFQPPQKSNSGDSGKIIFLLIDTI